MLRRIMYPQLTTLGAAASLLAAIACGSSGSSSTSGGDGGSGGADGGASSEGGGTSQGGDAAGGTNAAGGSSGSSGGGTTGAGGTASGPTLTGGPRFPGAGSVAGIPLQPGLGPETADDCPPPDGQGTTETTQVRDSATLCFYGDGQTDPAATIEQVIEVVEGTEYVHLRVTFNPTFADNTFGAGSVGWDGQKEGQREFDKLVGSDHLEMLLTDCAGDTVMQFRVDYVSADPDSESGYGSLGVTGGDGRMIVGDAADVLAVATSLDRNLNGCGYSDYLVDSPTTDASLTSNPDTPNWDYRVVYEVWVDATAFESCFGQAYLESVHASPSKGADNTLIVEGGPCPPEWDVPYCVDSTSAEGVCDTGTSSPCPQNTTPFADCPDECVPIPFAGYPDRAACPAGYILDLASEGQYCVPETGSVCP